MADTVTSQLIADGPRNAIYKFTNISDGTGETDVVKVDVSALSANERGQPVTSLSIESVRGASNGMSVRILEEATADQLILEIPADTIGEYFCEDFGGIPNSKSAGYTGNILFTTVGAANGDSYSIIMLMRKHFGD